MGDLKIENQSENKSTLFRQYAAMWLNDYIKGIRRPSTYERYSQVLEKHIYPSLANNRIMDVTRGEVRNLLLRLYNGGLSKSMIRIIHACISGPMSYALDEEIINANPVTGLTKRLQLKTGKKPIEPMTREETYLFLETCHLTLPEYYPFFLCAFRTGLRLGELLGLRLGDIDWNGRFIEIRRAYKRGHTGPTKTGRIRRVDMSDQLKEVLLGLFIRRKAESMKAGNGGKISDEVLFA